MCEPIDDLPIHEFLMAMAREFAKHAGGEPKAWLDYAKEIYDDVINPEIKTAENASEFDWCEQAAREWAMEEIYCWA